MTMSKYLGANPVFVAGGSSGVGLEVIKKLSARGDSLNFNQKLQLTSILHSQGTPVKVLVRRVDAKEYLSTLPGVTVALGDALDESAVQSCMEG